MKREYSNIILLLGSYDPDTKNILNVLKERIAEEFGGLGVYVFLLDDIIIYSSSEYFAVAEKIDDKVSIYVYDKLDGYPFKAFEINISGDLSAVVKKLIEDELNVKVSEIPIMDKLWQVAQVSKAIIVVRDKEETRGGEIAELTFLILRNYGDKCILFKREGIKLSGMLMEFLDMYKVNIRSYSSQNELIESVIRYLRYRFEEYI